MTTPEAAIRARLDGADRALRRLLADQISGAEITEAAALARRAIEGIPTHGRPLFAANSDLDWPDDAHLMLWHAATLIREHRGDGHVAALTAPASIPAKPTSARSRRAARASRRFSRTAVGTTTTWEMGAGLLRNRGWLDGDGKLTGAGNAGREAIEATTDRLATGPLDRLGAERTARLLALLGPIENELARNDAIRYPNPIGVSRPY